MSEDYVSYILDDAEKVQQEYPENFQIPPASERDSLEAGDLVKLIFRISHDEEVDVERMWVVVGEKSGSSYLGVLRNDPFCTDQIESGLDVQFQAKHVIQIERSS